MNDRQTSVIFTSCVCQTMGMENMLISSCKMDGRVLFYLVSLPFHLQKSTLSVLKVETFEKKGLIHELPDSANHLCNIGKVGAFGDYIVAATTDGSLQLFNLSR